MQAANEVYREIRELTPAPGAGVGPDPDRRLGLMLHYLKHYDAVDRERTGILIREAFTSYLAAERFAEARTLIERHAESVGLADWEVQEFYIDTHSAASDIGQLERAVQDLLRDGIAPMDRKLRAAFSMASVLETLRRYGDARDLYRRIVDVIGTDESPAAQTGLATARAGIERMSTLVELTGR